MQLKNKIIFTVTNDLNFDQRMQRICSTLSNAGYEVELVGRILPTSIELNTSLNFKQTRIKCIFKKGKLFYLEYNIRLIFYLLNQKFNTICSVDLDTLLAGGMVSKILNINLFFDAHEHFTEVPEVTNRKFTKYVWSKIAKIFIPKAKLCYTVGPALAQIFEELYNNKFEVILNVPIKNEPDSNNDISGYNINKPYILYQGALNKSRGLEQSILAIQQVENTLLVIAGEGDLSLELRDLVIKNNLENKVMFLGFIKPTELKKLTANAKIGLNLLEHNGESYYYSLANKFFDYLQAGVPCLCANFPEYIAINNQFNCCKLINCEVDTIAKEMSYLLNNEAVYSLLSKNALEASENYNWSVEKDKLLKMYEKFN